MKKFIITVSAVVCLYLAWDYAYYHMGIYVDIHPYQEVTTFMKVDGDQIFQKCDSGYEPFEIRGVNMGSGEPGEWATDFDIDKETYLRWFRYIQEMGANTIRIYTVQSDEVYFAFYEYNKDYENHLWLCLGVGVNDYVQECDFYEAILIDCWTIVDVIHGKRKISLGRMASSGAGSYRHDISSWVIGYILGVEWEDVTVVYTDETNNDM